MCRWMALQLPGGGGISAEMSLAAVMESERPSGEGTGDGEGRDSCVMQATATSGSTPPWGSTRRRLTLGAGPRAATSCQPRVMLPSQIRRASGHFCSKESNISVAGAAPGSRTAGATCAWVSATPRPAPPRGPSQRTASTTSTSPRPSCRPPPGLAAAASHSEAARWRPDTL